MPDRIYPLDVNVAAELRAELTNHDAGAEWRITRLCEQAQAVGYHAGYTRGRVDGRHREEADRAAEHAARSVAENGEANELVHLRAGLASALGIRVNTSAVMLEQVKEIRDELVAARLELSTERTQHAGDVDREALLDVLTTANDDWKQMSGQAGAHVNYLEHVADRLIAADAIAGTP